MRIPRLYVDLPLREGITVRLEGSEAHYPKNVLRCRTGTRLTLFNGEGGEFSALVGAMDRQGLDIAIESFVNTDRESPVNIHLGLGITKRDAMDTAIRKATELGVSAVTPVITAYTDLPKKALAGRPDHWQQILRSACEQCERNRLPALSAPVSLTSWLSSLEADTRLVAHPGGTGNLDELLSRAGNVAILTGPEGGFSDEEIIECEAARFRCVGLGPRILRADTATVVMLSLVQARLGDLNAGRERYVASRTPASCDSM